MKRPALLALLLALLASALYAPMLGADFVWDARAQILTDTFIHQPAHLLDALSLRVLAMDVLDANRPAHLASLMLDAAVWGKNPLGFHLTSLLLHGAFTALVFLFARRHVGAAPAFAGALLFAVHPLNCEAVAEVSYREDLLAAFFTLAALNFAARWQPRARWLAAGVVVCSLAAVAAKECGIVAPVAVAAYVFFFHKEHRRAGFLLAAAAALAVGAFLTARFALAVETSVIFTEKPRPMASDPVDLVLIQIRIWAFYFRQMLWPSALCADYGPWSIRAYSFGFSLLGVMLFIGLNALAAWRHRLAMLGVVIFWGALLPVSNFIPIYRAAADRFLYLPLAGFALVLAAVGASLRPRLLLITAVVLALPLAAVTWQRQTVWQGSLALWSDTFSKNPMSYTAATNLAEALLDTGRYDEAIQCCGQAAKLMNHPVPLTAAIRAIALEKTGRLAEAETAYKEALALDDRYREPQRLAASLVFESKNIQVLAGIAERLPQP